MLDQLVELCTSNAGLFWLNLGSDLAIAFAYFAIPATMAFVLRHRKNDIPYPWLWSLFVAFIIACGLTHVAHAYSTIMGVQLLGLQAGINIATALVSVGTAIGFALILPQIKMLPSPREQKQRLEQLVAERTMEKDRLIREINHRVGNQLQIISSLLSIEQRRASESETLGVIQRLRGELDKMARQHSQLSQQDYLAAGVSAAGDIAAPLRSERDVSTSDAA